MKVKNGSGFNKRLGYRHWIYSNMASIPVNTEYGQIIGLEVLPASDGSGNYVWVVRLDNADIEIGTVDVKQTYNVTPPVVENGGTIGFQSDVNGNLKVNLASLPELPAGSNVIGAISVAPTSSSSFALTPGSSSQLENSHIIKAGPGNLYSLYVITQAVGGYLMTFDSATVPPDGPVSPVECVPVSPNSIVGISADGSPADHYSTGIVAVFSYTGPFTKTTISNYGNAQYGVALYSGNSNPVTAFFKWSAQ